MLFNSYKLLWCRDHVAESSQSRPGRAATGPGRLAAARLSRLRQPCPGRPCTLSAPPSRLCGGLVPRKPLTSSRAALRPRHSRVYRRPGRRRRPCLGSTNVSLVSSVMMPQRHLDGVHSLLPNRPEVSSCKSFSNVNGHDADVLQSPQRCHAIRKGNAPCCLAHFNSLNKTIDWAISY